MLDCEFIASPNFDERSAEPEAGAICLAVIHAISLPPGEFNTDDVERFFCNQLDVAKHEYYRSISHLQVSSHFYIKRDGKLIQLVPLSMRAWHAGESTWRGRSSCNDFSVGIELQGDNEHEFTTEQYDQLADLLSFLCKLWPQMLVAGHQDIAPDRKWDPGDKFDWDRLWKLIGTNKNGRT